eukprot:COSAG05_NODE_317_length_11545_cov_73.981391_3_plen_199_part_00
MAAGSIVGQSGASASPAARKMRRPRVNLSERFANMPPENSPRRTRAQRHIHVPRPWRAVSAPAAAGEATRGGAVGSQPSTGHSRSWTALFFSAEVVRWYLVTEFLGHFVLNYLQNVWPAPVKMRSEIFAESRVNSSQLNMLLRHTALDENTNHGGCIRETVVCRRRPNAVRTRRHACTSLPAGIASSLVWPQNITRLQ